MLLTSASTPTLSQLSKPLNSGFFVFVVASSAIPYIHNNGAVDMTEKRIHKYFKLKQSANDKVQALADRDHGGNFHAALHRVIEEYKA